MEVFVRLSDRLSAEQNPYKYTVIFDFDGVLSDPNHRLDLLDQRPADWEGFFNRVGDDPVHHHNIILMKIFAQAGYNIVIMTGRPERTRRESIAWLKGAATIGRMEYNLLMRKDGDYRPDTQVKREMVAALRASGGRIIMAFDDRPSVRDMYLQEGIPCHLVDPGTPHMEKVAQYEKKGTETAQDQGDTAPVSAQA